ILIHIVESASAKMIGNETDDLESRQDKEGLKKYATLLQEKGYAAEIHLGYRNRSVAIAKIVKERNAQLLILGSHGHRGWKDLILGETINKVRHLIDIPVFIAK